MAINTVIGLYYYLLWAVRLFTPSAADEHYDAAPGLGVRAAITAAAAGAVVLSVAPQIVLQTVTQAT